MKPTKENIDKWIEEYLIPGIRAEVYRQFGNINKGESEMSIGRDQCSPGNPEPKSAMVLKRMEEIQNRMDSVRQLSAQLEDRLFGPIPQSPLEAGKNPKPCGFFEEVISGLGEMLGQVNSAHSILQSILNRIG